MPHNPVLAFRRQTASEEAPAIRATPFVWRPESKIPPRRWLYGRHLLRRFVSMDVAAGGIGKSSLKIGEALAMASGRALYGKAVHEGPLRVWLYNLEDPAEEIERRIHAAARYFEIDPSEIGDRLFVDSGRAQPCVIAIETESGARIVQPVVDAVIETILERQIDVVTIDPFISSHAVNENDNRAMDLVAKQWARIADACDCAIDLVHHLRKGNGMEATADSARGARAVVDAARSVLVYNRMTADEAERAGLAPETAGFYFRTTNDKANLAPPERADWHRMNNVDLANGDRVGVAAPWRWPDPFDGVSVEKTKRVQRAVAEGRFRADPRSTEWVGVAVASALGMSAADKRQRPRIAAMIGQWVATGVLVEVEREDAGRRPRRFVEVGAWITE